MQNDPTIDEILKFDPRAGTPAAQDEDIVSDILKFDPRKKDAQLDSTPKLEQNTPTQDPTAMPEISWGEALSRGVKNIPSSGYEYLKGVFHALTHPKETITNFKTLAKGLVKTGTLRIMADQLDYDYKDLNAAAKDKEIAIIEQIEAEIGKKYGTEAGFKQAIADDPVGVWADLSSIIVPVAKGAGMAKLARRAEPLSAAVEIASQPLRLIPESWAIKPYQSAVKFATTLPMKERLAVTRTAVAASNQIMPTASGMVKLRKKIDNYNATISDLINKSTNRNVRLNTDQLWSGIGAIKDEFKRSSDQPRQWDRAFDQLRKEWDEMLKISPTRTPEEVQKLKQGIYKDLESFYEKHKATPAKVELRKAVARNARKMLEDIIPEIKQLNQKEGALIELWDAIESKANRITNRDFAGIGIPIKMGAGGSVGYAIAGKEGAAVGTTLGLMIGVYDTPQVKAKIALVVNKMREQGIRISPTKAALTLGLYQASEMQEIKEKQEPEGGQ